ncbi:MAG TPA: patatin-like phospholipase family protein [Spirochaetota bacterium]|nr:patatin-like phospholipase family protein [Spirochaetota bacterium]HPI88016.1 patatin-like phospholipase family protein [Spirochaetota bacterium]HPR46726.1 patatin-like phospholipase family protein [Spirochaetota bacterium]
MKTKASSTPNLAVYAGKKALALLRDEGFNPGRIKVVAGAAGGPKWLVLHGLDKVLFPLFKKRKEPLYLVGSSIGTWRFLAAVFAGHSRDRFREAYIEQRYSGKPTPEEVTVESRKILDQLIGKNPPEKALAHPFYRLSILAVRSRHLIGSEIKQVQTLGLAGAVFANLANRKLLRYFFERTLFFDARDIPPFYAMKNFPTARVTLTGGNLADAVLASGSIPLVMSGINNIEGARPGVYRDGGMIDYHLDIDYLGKDDDGIALYPHYTDTIVPGWLDKTLKWRVPSSPAMDRLVLVCPSREFVTALPYSKIPDRDDFHLFAGDDKGRIGYWREVVALSERLGGEFIEAVDSGRIGAIAKPLPWE